MSAESNQQIPDWFKPHAEAIYLSLYAVALGLNNVIDTHAKASQLLATCAEGLADSLSGPTPDLENMRAELESQHEIFSKHAEAVKNLPIVAVQAIDQIGVILERSGIKVPPELQGGGGQ